MSLYTETRHPRAHARRNSDPGQAEDRAGFNERLAAWITARIGSMWTVYICLVVTVAWMVLASRPVLGFDPYPYPFLLFLGNVAQLLLIFIILLGQQVLGRAADRRSMHTYEDAEAILVDCMQIQNHLIAQDAYLASGTDLRAADHAALASAAERVVQPPPAADEEHVSLNGRLAAWLTNKVGTMTAFYVAAVFQIAWMIAGQLLGFDPYPYLFLLFLSSQTQLILMFVIMVGQQVLGQAAEKRAAQTYLNAEAVLHTCERLQAHLHAQDLAIRHVVERLQRSPDSGADGPAAGSRVLAADDPRRVLSPAGWPARPVPGQDAGPAPAAIRDRRLAFLQQPGPGVPDGLRNRAAAESRRVGRRYVTGVQADQLGVRRQPDGQLGPGRARPPNACRAASSPPRLAARPRPRPGRHDGFRPAPEAAYPPSSPAGPEGCQRSSFSA